MEDYQILLITLCSIQTIIALSIVCYIIDSRDPFEYSYFRNIYSILLLPQLHIICVLGILIKLIFNLSSIQVFHKFMSTDVADLIKFRIKLEKK